MNKESKSLQFYLFCLILISLVAFTNTQRVVACDDYFLPPTHSQWPGIQAKLDNLQVHTGAESGFFKKIEIVKKATKGDELSLMYFIYDKDFTSSYLSKELIYAARRGAKVNLLVDYFMGQKTKKVLQYLESFPNINVKLFRPPTQKFHQYIKNKLGIQNPEVFTLGLAKQNKELIQEAIMTSPKLMSKVEKIMSLSGNLEQGELSYPQIMLALNELTEYEELPIYLEEYSQRLHHKWLGLKKSSFLETRKANANSLTSSNTTQLEFIIGGRNISDEYHIGLQELQKYRRGLLRKRNYPFIDTEVSALTNDPLVAQNYQSSFNSLWNKPTMTHQVAPLNKNSSVYKSQENKMNYRVSIIKNRLPELESRVSQGRRIIQKNQIISYYSENAPDLGQIENSQIKDINITWKQLLKEAKPEDGPIQIVSAYVYFYADLIETLSKALKRGVSVEFYTNSMQTTDLSIINMGTYKELDQWRSQIPNSDLLKVYELQLPKGQGSLHAKIIKVGSRIGIGSANSDPRSFFHDTNNVLFFDLSHSSSDANLIFADYLKASHYKWSELTPQVINTILEQLSQHEQSRQILKALEVPFFQNQL